MLIPYLVNFIKRRMDKQILNLMVTNDLVSVDELIKNNIIYDILMTDLNLVGGRAIEITLDASMIVVAETNKLILRIPAELRNNSKISSVQVLRSTLVGLMNNQPGINISQQTQGGIYSELLKVDKKFAIAAHTSLSVLGNEYIVIEQPNIQPQDINNTIVSLEVNYSQEFDELDGDYYPEMGKIALLAAKMYAYNELSLEVEKAFIHNPHTSEALMNRINTYDTAQVEYDDSFDLLGKISALNDDRKQTSLIRFSI